MTWTERETTNDWQARTWPRQLHHIDRRYLIVDLLLRQPGRVWSPRELAGDLTRAGFELGRQPNKVVADTLRAEVRCGRVVRVGHGRYVLAHVPDTTRRRIRRRARLRRDRITQLAGAIPPRALD